MPYIISYNLYGIILYTPKGINQADSLHYDYYYEELLNSHNLGSLHQMEHNYPIRVGLKSGEHVHNYGFSFSWQFGNDIINLNFRITFKVKLKISFEKVKVKGDLSPVGSEMLLKNCIKNMSSKWTLHLGCITGFTENEDGSCTLVPEPKK